MAFLRNALPLNPICHVGRSRDISYYLSAKKAENSRPEADARQAALRPVGSTGRKACLSGGVDRRYRISTGWKPICQTGQRPVFLCSAVAFAPSAAVYSLRFSLKTQKILIPLGLAALVSIVFGQTAHFGWVRYDDHDYVYRSGRVTSGSSFSNLVWAFTYFHAANWRRASGLSGKQASILLRFCSGGPITAGQANGLSSVTTVSISPPHRIILQL